MPRDLAAKHFSSKTWRVAFHELLPSLRPSNELQHTADHSVKDIYVPKDTLVVQE